jgi:hypothetical protein
VLFKYSVIRYVPNLVRDEATNLGVLLEVDNPPGLYLRFLGQMSRVRRKYPDANVLAIRRLSEHFGKLQQVIDPNQPVFDFAKGGSGLTLESLHKGSIDTNFQVTAPRATVGDDPVAELDEVFELFVAEIATEPKERGVLAPSRFRRRVAKRLRQTGLLSENYLQPQFQAAGTVQPWIFDFGQRNGSLTLVQSLVLQTAPDEAMNRALLLQARVEDVAEAEHKIPRTVAVIDEQASDAPAWKYLNHHKVVLVWVDDSDSLKMLMEAELDLR